MRNIKFIVYCLMSKNLREVLADTPISYYRCLDDAEQAGNVLQVRADKWIRYYVRKIEVY